MFYFASQQRFAIISENFICTVFPNISLYYGPLKRSAYLAYLVRIPPASEFAIPQTVLQCAQNFIVVLICIFVLAFLEPLMHDSKYGDKR